MSCKYTLFISLVPILSGLILLSSSAPSLAHPIEQIGPTPEWDEGRQVIAGVTQNDTAIPAVATTPGTFYRTFSGSRFQPTSSALTYAALGGAIYATALPPGGYSFSLDFDLPFGATITEVVFFVIDNDSTSNIDLGLRSYDPQADTFSSLESAASSGNSPQLQVIVIPVDPPVQVDNTTTSYRLRVAPGVASSAHLLRGARIGYTIPMSFLPLITR